MKGGTEHTDKAPSHPFYQEINSTVLRDTKDFVSLRDEWDDLYRNCPSATPFQSWEWLFSWWEAYEAGYKLRLVTLRATKDGRLAGLLPLMVRRGRLLLIGGDKRTLYSDVMTPYKDVLVREGWEEAVARAGARALEEVDGWRVADLQELMPEAAAWHLFREWQGPKANVPITDYVLIRARSWEELLSSLSRRLRKTARRTLRQADQDGLKCEPANQEDAKRAASTLVELHRELWKGRHIAPEHLTPRYEAFIQAAARRMTERCIGRISEFWRGNRILLSQFLVFDKDFVGVYMLGASEDASQQYQFDTLSNWDAMNVAGRRSSPYVSFMDGTSRHKLRWASEVVTSKRTILGRNLAFWVPYAGYHVLRHRYYALRYAVQMYVHSEGPPCWVKNATEGYYTLQSYINSESAPSWIRKVITAYYAFKHKYGYGYLRYWYELARARQGRSKANSFPKQ